jgi:hypothetical protein
MTPEEKLSAIYETRKQILDLQGKLTEMNLELQSLGEKMALLLMPDKEREAMKNAKSEEE